MSQAVTTIDGGLSALASANTPDELITLANQAAALQLYARRAKLGMVAQNRCAELRLRAERKLGELLTTTPRLHGRPKSVLGENTLPTLSDLGVRDRKTSYRAQRIAAVPTKDFEAYLRRAHHAGWEITTRGQREGAAVTETDCGSVEPAPGRTLEPGPSSQLTLCWRGLDSNF